MAQHPNEDVVDFARFTRGLEALADASAKGDRQAQTMLGEFFTLLEQTRRKFKIIELPTEPSLRH